MSRLGCTTTNKTEMSLITSKHSEKLNFTLFHPSDWLWHTFVYLCPALKCHFYSNILFPATCIPYRSGLRPRAPSNQFCHHLTHDALKTLICAFVPSHIDYCNSLFTGCPKNLICKLQKVLPASTVVLPGLTTYLWSYVLYTSFLLSPAFTTKLLFLPLNHWTTKPLPISAISPSCMFCLIDRLSADAWLHRFPPAHLKSSDQRAFFYQPPLLWNKSTLLFIWC